MSEGYRLLQCTETGEAPLEEQTLLKLCTCLPHPLSDILKSPPRERHGASSNGSQPRSRLPSHNRITAAALTVSACKSLEKVSQCWRVQGGFALTFSCSQPTKPRFLAFPVAFKKYPCPHKYTVWHVTIMTRNPVAPRQNDRLILSGSEFRDLLSPPPPPPPPEHQRRLNRAAS
ncbi:yorkie-like protein [Platysternon megacephalum]|uniref:Yorkie-like protein n=1 Tax=Platysternon megacephalum TaxID=55544 RepID=A0A4D9E157_9SAUR|nr:yorkie-like protein [Platysternon megacephalum]